GTPSARTHLTVNDAGDRTAPVITLVSPQTDIQLDRAVTKITFTVSDAESPIAGTPTLTVDGNTAEVTRIEEGRYSAVPPSGSIGEGTHKVQISAVSGGGTATKDFTVIIGGKIESVISVTADGKPVAGALVTMGGESKLTSDDGTVSFSLAPGEYQYTVSMDGYLSENGSANISAGSRTKNVVLEAGGTMQVVVSAGEQPVNGAAVTFGTWSAVSDKNGIAKVKMPYGTYNYQVSASGYKTEKGSFTFAKDTAESLNVALNVNKSSEFPAYLNIKDITGKPICGINVTLDGVTSTTDVNGDVLFLKNVGSYECVISGEAYKTFSGTINVDSSGKTQAIEMKAAGVSYDEDSEVLSLETGYKAWTKASGGEEIKNGYVVERDRIDRTIYIENSSGERAPFIIPALSGVWIRNVETVNGSGGKKVEITVGNYNDTSIGNMWLMGVLYDNKGISCKTTMSEISTLTAGEKIKITLDFEQNIADYTCKIYLWDKETLIPICPLWCVNE
ncbi:MAG: carboxypeptidase regulatory-like domain-containing protein, partial [Clostridia bacterium]|nr:carboxypeptidase regulatory-like domain-containing protein [Clostridia bacterium]